MNKIILITSPKYDDGTEYLSYYASLVLKKAEDMGVKTKNFGGENATLENVSKFIEKQNPKMIFINGHGDENVLYGHNDKILFSCNNINLLKNRITYARACNAGASLGQQIVKDNNGCFIGYKYSFSFWIDTKWSAKPSNDNTAKLYLEPSNEVVISLIERRTTREADERSKSMMIANMKKILKMREKREPEAMGMLKILWNNLDGQAIYGNSEMVF